MKAAPLNADVVHEIQLCIENDGDLYPSILAIEARNEAAIKRGKWGINSASNRYFSLVLAYGKAYPREWRCEGWRFRRHLEVKAICRQMAQEHHDEYIYQQSKA